MNINSEVELLEGISYSSDKLETVEPMIHMCKYLYSITDFGLMMTFTQENLRCSVLMYPIG